MKYFFHIALLIFLTGIHSSLEILYAQDLSGDTRADHSGQPVFTGSALYNKTLGEAIRLQNIADSLEDMAYRYRQDLMYMDNVTERRKIQFQLGILEDQINSIQAEADSLFNILPELQWQIDRENLLILDTVINGIKVYHFNTQSLAGLDDYRDKEEQKESPAANLSDSLFSIEKRSVYSAEHPFETDFRVPPGVFYRIQLGAYSKEAAWDQFGGIRPITLEKTADGKIIKYYAGKFSLYADAESAQIRVRATGFKDAFIVSYFNGQKMSVEQVREFEKSDR